MKRLFIAFGIISLMLSCKTTQNMAQDKQVKKVDASTVFVEENRWELISFKGMKPDEAGFMERVPSITINMEKSQTGGYGGCNSFGGEVIVEGNTIQFDKLFSTKMYCQGVPEDEFFKMLQQKLDFKLVGDQLSLLKDGDTLLEFKRTTPEK